VRAIACLALALCLPGLAGTDASAPPDTGSLPVVLLRRSAKATPDGSNGDVLVAADIERDVMARRAAEVMADPEGYTQFVLRLDRFARTYLLNDPELPADRRAALERPPYLFLSDRQGGFPAEGFWLEGPDGSIHELRGTPFVDLVVNEGDFDPTDSDGLVAIHAHELGHLIMASLAGPPPRRASNGVHFTTVRTDGWLAFVEGWGEHFQPMAVDHHRGGRADGAIEPAATPGWERAWYERFAREQVDGCWICPANLRFIRWQGAGERRLRDAGIRSNLFIHELALPAPLLGDGRPPFEARMYRDVVPPPLDGSLRSGPRALASEGVLATFFHRLASDERLRAHYRERAFYRAFLPDEPGAELDRRDPPDWVSPAENVYLKVFHVLHRAFRWGDWPLVEFVKGYAATFPDEAAIVYDIFLDVTRGVTVERAAAARHAEPGYLATLRGRLLAGSARIDGHLGRPLWLVVPRLSFGMGVFRYFLVPSQFTFDLNAADVADLRSVPGVSAGLAASIVKTRDERGAFEATGDLASVTGVTPDLLSRFASMRERMQARRAARSSQKSNPTWMMNWLVRVLKGSYYLAAAWQFGRALALAALFSALTMWLTSAALRDRQPADAPGAKAGSPASPPEPRSVRRAARSFLRGCAVAAWPLAASAGLYAAGILPRPLTMALVGVVAGLALAGLQRLANWPAVPGRFAPLATVAGSVAAAILIGWMY
jgi:hypothetical protein